MILNRLEDIPICLETLETLNLRLASTLDIVACEHRPEDAWVDAEAS